MISGDSVFKLTKDQQRAFNRLKKAHKDCIRLGVVFYNSYGTIGALDACKFERRYFDDNPDGGIEEHGANDNEFNLECNEWADDDHFFSPKGTHQMTAFEEGVRARVHGKSLKFANPYMIGSLDYYEWRKGWKEADKGDDCENGRGEDEE